MSDLHFVERDIYKEVITISENPKNIIVAGSLARERIENNFYKKTFIEKKFKLKFFKKNVILTYHPEISEKLNRKN